MSYHYNGIILVYNPLRELDSSGTGRINGVCNIIETLSTNLVDVYRTFIVQNAKFRNYSKIHQAESYKAEMTAITAGHQLNNTIDSYLMEPIQRTMRYEMLVGAVQKEFEKSGRAENEELGYKLIKRTVEKCRNAAIEINELQNTAENHILSRNGDRGTVGTIQRCKAAVALRKERVHRGKAYTRVQDLQSQ